VRITRSRRRRGRRPEPASQELRDELETIAWELETIGSFDVATLIPMRAPNAVLEEAISEREWLAVSFYLHLISEHLLALTEDEPAHARRRTLARTATGPALSYEQNVNNGDAHELRARVLRDAAGDPLVCRAEQLASPGRAARAYARGARRRGSTSLSVGRG
jgi:hypothetical protein